MNSDDRHEDTWTALRSARHRIPSVQSPGEHLSRQELADAVNEWVFEHRGRVVAVDANYIGKLERGKIRWPNSDYRAALRAVLLVSTDRALGFVSGSAEPPRPAVPAVIEAHVMSVGGTIAAAAGIAEDGPLAEARPLDETFVTATRVVAEFGMWAEQLSVGSSVTIEHLHQRTRRLSQDTLTQPPGISMIHAASLAEEVFVLVRRHQKPAHSRDLHVIAAQLCTILAWLAGDLGLLDVAELQGRIAFVCAELADDPQATAWALVAQSKTAFWRHDYRRAAHLADRGMRLDPPGTSAVMLACQHADALSQLGDQTDTVEAIHRAEYVAEHEHGNDDIGGLLSCGPLRQANYLSGAYLMLGQTELALTEVDRAFQITTKEGHGFGTIAQMHLTKTLAHARAGRIDAIVDAVRPVLDLEPEHRLTTFDVKIDQLAGILRQDAVRSSCTAVQLREELDAYRSPQVGGRQLTPGPHKEKVA